MLPRKAQASVRLGIARIHAAIWEALDNERRNMKNTLHKTVGQAASHPVRAGITTIGRALRTALFHTVHIAAWVAYFGWLLVPPILWFSASPAHSHTATYWVGGIYLIAAIAMTWSGYYARKLFRLWMTRDDTVAGWLGVLAALPVLFAPALPFLLLMLLLNMNETDGDEGVDRRRNPILSPRYAGLAGNLYTRDD